jgi:hypothetical protein
MKGQVPAMITEKPDTDFDRLINAAKHKLSQNSTENIQFHRRHSRPPRPPRVSWGAPIAPDPPPPRPLTVNFTHFIKHPGANDCHELADPKFIIGPPPAGPQPAPGHKPIEDLGNKRWRYQGKTYKEEPIGRS